MLEYFKLTSEIITHINDDNWRYNKLIKETKFEDNMTFQIIALNIYTYI